MKTDKEKQEKIVMKKIAKVLSTYAKYARQDYAHLYELCQFIEQLYTSTNDILVDDNPKSYDILIYRWLHEVEI
jgi:hypothetical protein